MPPRREKTITPKEAFRAVYLDFEGLMKDPPALAGWACEFDLTRVVLDQRLEPAARKRGLSVMNFEEFIDEVIARCEDEGRVIVGFSQAEKNTVDRYTSRDLSPFYRDARLIAKRWVNRLHPDAEVAWELKDLLEFIGFPWPRYLGEKKATKKIRYVREMLERKGSFEELTGTAKRHWTNLLTYNMIDCLGMRDLVMRAGAELAVAEEHGIFAEAG